MGSNQFQREYIEYLQKLNTDLLNRLNNMKANYECKILSKDWNKNYLISTLEEVLNICTVVPQEIDLFFEKISAAMSAFKSILLRKSEMLQVMEKISKALNSIANFNSDLMTMDDSGFVKTQFSESRLGKKAGTVKVSPMINGHVISTEPRIHLNRMPGVFTPSNRGSHQLSPIIEASPDTSSDLSNLGSLIFKEVKIPLERINPNQSHCNYISEESPKSRFKGPKAWKKSLSSRKFQDHQRNAVFLENNDNSNKKLSAENCELSQLQNVDPQEGPSWLYQENSEINSPSRYMDYRRRKHRFATVFESDEDCHSCFKKKSKNSVEGDSSEFHRSHSEANEEEFEEIKRRVINGSDDFICESFSSEREESNSPLKKRHRKTKRGYKRSSDKDIKDFNMDFEKRSSTPYSKIRRKKSISNSPVYSDSSDEENSQRNFMPLLIKDRKSSKKRPVKLLNERISAEIAFEGTPGRTECGEREERSNKRSKDSKKNALEKNSLENEMFVELEDCMVDKKDLPRPSKAENVIEEKKFKKSLSKSRSRSPVVILQENVGRVKRKAAPTFKLVEPKLKTKLRRN